MVANTGDKVTFRDVSGEHRLTGVANDGVVQYEVNGELRTTDVSEITRNFNESARTRASLEKALDESANGDTVSLGSFSQYLADDKIPDPIDRD